MVSQNVEADAAVAVDIRVVDAGGKVDLRGLEGVVGREVDRQEEHAASVRRVALHVKKSAQVTEVIIIPKGLDSMSSRAGNERARDTD